MATLTALNSNNCNTSGNTGESACDYNPSTMRYLIFMPKNFVIPATATASTATMLAYIKAAIIADNRGGATPRFFITPELTNFEDGTEKPVTEKRDNFSKIISYPPYMWSWLMNCKFWRYRSFRVFEGAQNQYDILTLDDNGVLVGTVDPAGTTGICGVDPYTISVPDFEQHTTAKDNAFPIKVGLKNNTEIIEKRAWINLGTTKLPSGLVDVSFTSLVTTTSSHLRVSGNFGGGSDLGMYSASIAVAGAWVITDNGTPATPTAVAWVPAAGTTQGYYDLTFSAPFTTAHVISASLAAPSVLLAISATLNIISETPITATMA